MTTGRLVFLGVFEVIALVVITWIWAKRRHRRLIVRLISSAVLLVPVFGLMAYFFLRENPDEHPYDTDTMRGAAESIGDGNGGHH
jgi:hypothetical protein